VSAANKDELEGITLSVYLYAVKKGAPVGPRDVVKGANLSSPSVAYRHLEKLEDLGLLQKNEYGEYVVKRKARVSGYLWIGRYMMPKMLVYGIVFMGVLIWELYVLIAHYEVEDYEFKVFFFFLILITASAMAVFFVEGLLQRMRAKRKIQTEQAQNTT
jgi:DNA-binding transcriptional ArsR family regulator